MFTLFLLTTGCAQMRSIETPNGDLIKVKANIKLYAKPDDETIVIKNTMWQSNKGHVEFILADTGEVRWAFLSTSEKRKRSIRFRFGEVPPGYTQSSPADGSPPHNPMVNEIYVVSIPYVGMFNLWEAHGAEFVAIKRTPHGWQEIPRQQIHLQTWIDKKRSNRDRTPHHRGALPPHRAYRSCTRRVGR
jgi:hypothetical protein